MHYLEHIVCSSTKSLALHLRWNNARFFVRCQRSSPATSIQPIANSFIEKYNSACDAGGCEEAGAIVKQFFFRFRGLHGNAKLIYDVKYARENIVVDSPVSVCQLSVDKSRGLPRYSTTDIHVLEKLANNFNVALVTVDGQSMCSKTGSVSGEDAAQRELDCLWKITTSYLGTSLRVPKLLGLIEVPDSKRVVGFLEEYIPVSDSWELSTLGNIRTVLGVEEAWRKKWASQVQEAVWLLHQIGIVWGGGNASNVLIHSDTDDAWVIDFGGHRIGSWLDLKETPTAVERDGLAVKKIFEFLESLRLWSKLV